MSVVLLWLGKVGGVFYTAEKVVKVLLLALSDKEVN